MKLVQNNKRYERKTDVRRAILATIGVTGIIVVGATIPNIFQLVPHLKKFSRYYAKDAFNRLMARGWVKFENENGNRYLKLTKEGYRQLVIHEARQEFENKKIKKWDKKWRVLIFDIKEIARRQRDQMRLSLRELGFKKLQNSVWVYPHDCENLVFLLKTYYGFGGNVLFMLVDRIENDKMLREHFEL